MSPDKCSPFVNLLLNGSSPFKIYIKIKQNISLVFDVNQISQIIFTSCLTLGIDMHGLDNFRWVKDGKLNITLLPSPLFFSVITSGSQTLVEEYSFGILDRPCIPMALKFLIQRVSKFCIRLFGWGRSYTSKLTIVQKWRVADGCKNENYAARYENSENLILNANLGTNKSQFP